jgi:hypothetical protein
VILILLIGEGVEVEAAFDEPYGDSNMDILSDIGF